MAIKRLKAGNDVGMGVGMVKIIINLVPSPDILNSVVLCTFLLVYYCH